nr:hypothetical protein Iba_chr07cCG6150 [Ipomoea batatas]GMD17847.1 hypothetical protein Iba_chr07dCG7540 [Ipomoea batatas]
MHAYTYHLMVITIDVKEPHHRPGSIRRCSPRSPETEEAGIRSVHARSREETEVTPICTVRPPPLEVSPPPTATHRHWTPRRRWWSVLPAGKGGRKRDGEGERERRTLPRATLPPPPLTRHRRCLASADAAYPPSLPRLRHESLPIVVPLALVSRFASGGWSPDAGRSHHVQGLWSRNNRTRAFAYGFGFRVEFNRLTFVHCGRGKVGAIPMFSNRQLDLFTVLTFNPHLS